MLFNAGLEEAMRRWKSRLGSKGWRIDTDIGSERLTNVRYADDLLLFATSMEDAIDMLSRLKQELRMVGLSVNSGKTKILTTESQHICDERPLFIECDDSFVEVVPEGKVHKYLGRAWPGNLQKRGQCNLAHRLSCGWMQFHQKKGTLMNRKIPLNLRLQLFDSVVSPAVLYSLASTPLTETQLKALDQTQRKMMRSIVGWIRMEDEEWHATGHRMKVRLEHALLSHPVAAWSVRRNAERDRLLHRLRNGVSPQICCKVHAWQPHDCDDARRGRGRPRRRWHE